MWKSTADPRPHRSILTVLLTIALLSVTGCKSGPEGEKKNTTDLDRSEKAYEEYVQSLPDLRVVPNDREVQLIVDYVEDSSLPTLSDTELHAFFHETETQVRSLLGYRVRFMLREKQEMAAFFAKRQDAFSHPVYSYPAKAWYLDPDAPGTLAEVTQTVTAVVNDKSPELLARYFGVMQGTKESYAQGITAHFFQKLRMLYAERDLHGKPLYGRDSPAIRRQSLSFPHWTSLALRESDVDFLVTNTALAGPDTGMPLYVINRGGVTTAFVENNKFRPYQAVGVFALYPFLSTGEYFQKERGVFPRAQLLDAGAVLFVHELGHLLLRKAENYTLDGSVFRAPRDLRYVEWAREVKAKHKTLKDDVPAITRY